MIFRPMPTSVYSVEERDNLTSAGYALLRVRGAVYRDRHRIPRPCWQYKGTKLLRQNGEAVPVLRWVPANSENHEVLKS